MTARRAVRVLAASAILAVSTCTAVGAAPAARADSTRDQSWWLTSLRIAEAHRITKGKGVVIGLVDTGIDRTQPDITGSLLPGVDIYTGKALPSGSAGYTEYHGTSMAGLLVGHGHGAGRTSGVLGVAPEAKVLPVKITRSYGLGSAPQVARGMEWAISLGADVISLSIATPIDKSIEDAVRRAWNKGIPVLAGVGNEFGSGMMFVNGVIPVTAVDRKNQWVKNTQVMYHSNGVAAPGAQIPIASEGGYYTTTGTSISTALAAGTMALIKARYPDASISELYRRLRLTADDHGPPGRDTDFGYGLINPVAALTEKLPPSPSPTPTASSTAPTPSAAASSGVSGPLLVTGAICLAIVFGGAIVGGLVLVARRAAAA